MYQVQSHAHVSLVINGFRHGGWAQVENPVEFPPLEDLINLKWGQDGIPYGTTIPKLGGVMMTHHIPNCDSSDWWIAEFEYWKRAVEEGLPHREYNGIYQDLAQGRQSRLIRGMLIQAGHQSTPGADYSAGLVFTRIRSNNDGARTVSPLVRP